MKKTLYNLAVMSGQGGCYTWLQPKVWQLLMDFPFLLYSFLGGGL